MSHTDAAAVTGTDADAGDPVAADPVAADVVVAGVALKDAAAALSSQLKSTVDVAGAFFTRSMQESPVLVLAGAAGAGFVLGGGLSAPLTRSLLRLSVRAAGAYLLDAGLQTLTAAVQTRPTAASSPSAAAAPATSSSSPAPSPSNAGGADASSDPLSPRPTNHTGESP